MPIAINCSLTCGLMAIGIVGLFAKRNLLVTDFVMEGVQGSYILITETYEGTTRHKAVLFVVLTHFSSAITILIYPVTIFLAITISSTMVRDLNGFLSLAIMSNFFFTAIRAGYRENYLRPTVGLVVFFVSYVLRKS